MCLGLVFVQRSEPRKQFSFKNHHNIKLHFLKSIRATAVSYAFGVGFCSMFRTQTQPRNKEWEELALEWGTIVNRRKWPWPPSVPKCYSTSGTCSHRLSTSAGVNHSNQHFTREWLIYRCYGFCLQKKNAMILHPLGDISSKSSRKVFLFSSLPHAGLD